MLVDLRTYLSREGRGAAVALARALGVRPVMVSQWASGTKAVPEDRAPALEVATNFLVRCEASCPNARWVRIPDEAWPHGKPLLDKATCGPAPAAPLLAGRRGLQMQAPLDQQQQPLQQAAQPLPGPFVV